MPERGAVLRLQSMSTLTMPAGTGSLLTDDMLARFGERAAVYDRENRFFDQDFD
jgi:hypothetical protein